MTKKRRTDPKAVQFKSFAIDTKAVADEPDDDGIVTFKAYAAVFGNVDSHNDVIHKGAFETTLKDWAEKNAPIPVYYNHGAFSSDPMDNMGFLAEAVEDAKGLAVEVALDVKHNPKAAYAHRLIKSDRLRELSIGYRAVRWDYSSDDGEDEWDAKRNLHELDLLEVSVVSIASNPLATVTEKAASLVYGTEEDEDEEKGDDDASTADLLRGVVESLGAVVESLGEISKLLDGSEDPDGDDDSKASEDGDDPDSDTEGQPAEEKGLSARTRAALAMSAVLTAETE